MPQLTKTQAQWLDHIKAAHQDGLSYTDYCKQKGLSVNALYNVKTKLLQLGVLTLANNPPIGHQAFVRTTVKPDMDMPTPLSHEKIQIRFPSGAEISLPTHPQLIEQLTQLVLSA